jgi:hypothetical protein
MNFFEHQVAAIGYSFAKVVIHQTDDEASKWKKVNQVAVVEASGVSPTQCAQKSVSNASTNNANYNSKN